MQSIKNALTGRMVSFGGTALLVMSVFAVALVLMYVVIRNQGWRLDFSEGDNFSLNEQSRQIVQVLSADPTSPPLVIVGFLGAAQAGTRDRAIVLLEDIQRTSNGRITYRFIDPDREPLTARAYEAETGQFFVVPLDENGELNVEQKEIISFFSQTELLNTLITASAVGDFRAYFVRLDDGISINDNGAFGAQVFAQELQSRYKWQAEELSLLELMRQGSTLLLNDGSADGEALVVLGGLTPLPDDQAKQLADYIEAGGALVMLSDYNPNGGDSLATAPNMASVLEANFGVKVLPQFIIDPPNQFPNNALDFIVTDFTPSEFLGYSTSEGLLYTNPMPIVVSETLPEGVSVTILAQTSPASYAKSGIDFTQQQDASVLNPAEGDPVGAFPVAILAENSRTGAKLALFSTPSLVFNLYRQYETLGLRNFDAVRKSLFRVAGYENYALSLASLPSVPTAQQTPLLADANTLSTINLVSVFVLPFGVLGVGILMWWLRRERVTA